MYRALLRQCVHELKARSSCGNGHVVPVTVCPLGGAVAAQVLVDACHLVTGHLVWHLYRRAVVVRLDSPHVHSLKKLLTVHGGDLKTHKMFGNILWFCRSRVNFCEGFSKDCYKYATYWWIGCIFVIFFLRHWLASLLLWRHCCLVSRTLFTSHMMNHVIDVSGLTWTRMSLFLALLRSCSSSPKQSVTVGSGAGIWPSWCSWRAETKTLSFYRTLTLFCTLYTFFSL